jgi:hypothetical protein
MPKTSSGADPVLRHVPARAIVAAVADAAERWRDADFPPRVRATAAIEARLGYTIPTIDYALDRLFDGLSVPVLSGAIARELGAVEALDGVVARGAGPPAWARGVDRVTIVSSDTTIGVAIPPLAYALCAKCRVTVKDRNDALVAAFAETLAEALPALRDAIDVRAWSGGNDAIEAAAFGDAGVVVAFGGPDALRAIRAACAPDATFVPFGHRASAGYVDRAAFDRDLAPLAAAIARDALLYDGDGCLSLHLLFVERAGDDALQRLVQALAGACAATAIEFPPGRRDPARAATAVAFGAAAAFRAANGQGRALRAPDGAWSIVVEPPADELPPFGGGTIPLIPVDGADDAAAYVARHRLPLQAVGVAPGFGDAAAAALADVLGAVRAAPLGTLQTPPLDGHHGGRPRIADFVRWIDCA